MKATTLWHLHPRNGYDQRIQIADCRTGGRKASTSGLPPGTEVTLLSMEQFKLGRSEPPVYRVRLPSGRECFLYVAGLKVHSPLELLAEQAE
jgi:hypothetical protein